MSTLMCPATLVLARHGDAEHVESWFSDEGGTLTTAGRQQAGALAGAMADRRIARVWCSDTSRAVQTAELIAATLGVGVVCRKSLREVFVGDLIGHAFELERLREVTQRWAAGELTASFPHGESGKDVVTRFGDQLAEIADEHRGETVLVIGHETALCTALPALSSNLSPPYAERFAHLRNGESVELVVDSDDWELVRWGARPFA